MKARFSIAPKATRVAAALALVLAAAGCGRLLPDFPEPPRMPATPTPAPDRTQGTGRADFGLIDAPIDGGTQGRIRRVGADFGSCHATLLAAGVQLTPVPDRVNSATCGVAGAGTLDIDRGTVARLAPAAPVMTCETALSFSIWRRQSVEPVARELLGSEVVQIDHFGTYACRGVNGQPGARPSAHSQAAALDFAGVRLRDGRRITIANDWHGSGPEAAFLRRIRDDACRLFGTVLSPEYNSFHDDHLHLEPGARPFCR